ncbi:MAG: tyrosine-protein phosphatase [Thermodesulfobacteriota bacterium]
MNVKNIGATRLNETTIRISWQAEESSEETSVSWTDSPDEGARPAGERFVSGRSWVDIKGLDPTTRYYFTLRANNKILGKTAERLVPLEGTFNFRDLGGYKTEDGFRVKWGRIFRSDNLANLTPRDHRTLEKMNLKLICDFRSSSEVRHTPDCLPEHWKIEYLHLPMLLGTLDAVEAMERIKKKDLDWLSPTYMRDGYLKNIELSADKWAAVIQRLLKNQRPLVFHCSAGKDRTGICAGLILLALGVPKETVLFDHGLSNHYLEAFLPKVYRYFETLGLETDRLDPYLRAPREAMLCALEHISVSYGSVLTYLKQKAGISQEQIEILKSSLLEDID